MQAGFKHGWRACFPPPDWLVQPNCPHAFPLWPQCCTTTLDIITQVSLKTCIMCAAGDCLSFAEHGFDPLHNRWDPHTAVRLSSCPPAHPGNSSRVQVLVCRVCLAGPCKALTADGEALLTPCLALPLDFASCRTDHALLGFPRAH